MNAPTATVCEAMPSTANCSSRPRTRSPRSTPRSARDLDGAVWVDVRERDEWEEGHIPGAVHVPRGNLESRDRGRRPRPQRTRSSSTAPPATRSAFAAKTLEELGYEDVALARSAASPTGSATATTSCCRARSRPRSARATRGTSLIPEIGEEGQLKLLDSKILLLGAGGLGSPGVALPRRGRHRHARDRRRRHRRRVEPAAADRALARTRSARRRSTRAKRAIEALNPDVEVDDLPRAPHLREHRPDPRRRLADRSSTAPTTSRRATSSTTRRSGTASPSCTARSTASRAR